MTSRLLLLGAVASLAFIATANAGDRDGWYVGLEGGGSWVEDIGFVRSFDPNPPGGPVTLLSGTQSLDTGWAALGTVGYGFHGPFRVEVEGGYRNNDGTTSGTLKEWSAMLNVLYDISLTDKIGLSLGAGAGGDNIRLDIPPLSFDEGAWKFAYQGIAGLNYELTDRLDLVLNYRYLRVSSPDLSGPGVIVGIGPGTMGFKMDDVVKHTATIGLRYHFGAPEMAPMIAPPPSTPTAPAEPAGPPHEFIVFFGYNKSNLTAEAHEVIKQAAAAAKQYGSASVKLVGHADRSGTPKYNMALSQRRATAVKGALVGEGIPAGSISTEAKGESDPMVPTADGVREPQNRRVHINL